MEAQGPSRAPLGASNESIDEADSDVEMLHKEGIKTAQEIIAYWEHQHANEKLSSHHFREWWRLHVPKLLAPIPSMDYLYPQSHVDDIAVGDTLLAPLDVFLCSSQTPETVLKNLADNNDPQAMCGKLFKMGEPTYSCRDCGHDPTCVLCVDCFKNSEHRNHRYKIGTSNGGGYCDCGDPEAWSAHVHCATHEQGVGTGQLDTVEIINKLPEALRARAKLVFTVVLDYIFELLATESMLSVPSDLTYKVPASFDQSMNDFSMGSNDDYCTVIYNDESHRYDDVIETIPRAVECDRATAIGITTMIDRNGRSIVKCSGFQVCQEVKKITERTSGRRGGKPLKVVIMHSHVVAHQYFAQRLLVWLQERMECSSSFRALIGAILLECPIPTGNASFSGRNSRLDNFLRNDIILWKSARTSVHHFLISAMLLGNDSNRRAFASVFSKNYGQMMKEFINDDHEHSFSVTSLSVQLFTVPTLAHYLIAHHDVLANLLRTFMSECERKRNDRGKLEFQRNLSNSGFQRANYILHDIKYLLTTCPDSEVCKTGWTNELRKGFLHGVANLVEILSWMQGMDLQVRQTSHHIDHEFDWEPCFRLQLNFIPAIHLVTKWCSTDKVVYIKTLRMLFKKLFEDLNSTGQEFIDHTIAGKTSRCLDYQISSKPVALHHPLTRLTAALTIFMSKFELTFSANELDIMEKPSPMQLMEPSLRTTVFVAQIQAGMWRRNGHSLVDQVMAYHDPRWRREMEDQDITMLQFAAANMDPNDFIINVVGKYQLVNWSNEEFDCKEDDSVRQINTLAEEFLSTLIYILQERFIPGVGEVTQEDSVRRDIIQLLCIEPMTHSALNRALAEDIHKETGLEKVVEAVAVFKKPSSAGSSSKGKYELKAEFFDRYNVFFYRYTREQQSKSEEAQRQRRKAASDPECNPPPCPPKFTQQFLPAVKIMECDAFLHILKLILERADNLRSRCFSENQVHKALHLIGLSLLEEERSNGYLSFTKASSERFQIYESLQRLVGSQRIESHKDLLLWTISTWQRVAGIAAPTDVKSPAEASSVASFSLKEPSSKSASDDKETERKRLAAERRKKVMDQMKNAQKNFMKENRQLFADTVQKKPRLNTDNDNDSNDMDTTLEEPSVVAQCLGPYRAPPPPASESVFHTCILCQDEDELTAEGKALVTAAFLQKSTVLSNRRQQCVDGFALGKQSNAVEPSLPLLPSDLHMGTHTSSCGHVMHASCWKTYFEDIQNSERNRGRLRSPQNFNVLKQEFLCPLCRSLSNTVIPLIPQLHLMQQTVTAPYPAHEKTEDMSTDASDSDATALARGQEVDSTKPIRLTFSHWLECICTTLKYKKELTKSRVTSGDGHGDKPELAGIEVENVRMDLQRILRTATEGAAGLLAIATTVPAPPPPSSAPKAPPSKRFYTCPLDQVVQEMGESSEEAALNFSRLFTDQEGQELVFSDSIHEMMSLFCKSVLRIAKDMELENSTMDEQVLVEAWNTCAFTIHASVHSELDSGRTASLLNSSASMTRHRESLAASLVRVCSVMGSNFGEPKIKRSHGLRLLSILTEVDGLENPSILDIDAFGLLVALTFCVPSLFNGDHAAPLPSGNVQDQHLLKLIYIVHLVQIMLTTDQFSTFNPDAEHCHDNDDEDAIVLRVLHEVRDAVGFASDNDGSEGLSGKAVWNDLKAASVPFLRVAAIFYHHLTNVPGPPELQHFSGNEHEELCKFLALPSDPTELFSEVLDKGMARMWASHPGVQGSLAVASSSQSRGSALIFPLKLNSLVTLPQDYSELINNVSTFTCPNFRCDESRVPAMCLICGEVMCSQSYCCQYTIEGYQSPVGACTAHTRVCGGGVGIFLRVRECKIVLLFGPSKGCFIQPPYVDQYGETDAGLRRGNPLRLCQDKYRKIYKLWLNHSIPQEISHSLEVNHLMINTPWFQL